VIFDELKARGAHDPAKHASSARFEQAASDALLDGSRGAPDARENAVGYFA